MMKPIPRRRITALAFVALFLLAEVHGASTTLAPSDPPEASTAPAEQAWQGGGVRHIFSDDFSAATARHYEGMNYLLDGSPFDYYGGAIATPGTDELGLWEADRWRHDPFRWGQEGARQSAQGELESIASWSQSHDALHLGADPLSGTYPAGVLAGAVSPVIDLRDVIAADASGVGVDATSGVPSSGCIIPGCSQNVEGSSHVSQYQRPIAQTDRDLHALGSPLSPVVGPQRDGQGQRVSGEPVESLSALTVRHAYGFLVEQGQFTDGGRVEVSWYDPLQGRWRQWQGLEPSPNTLRVGDASLEGGRVAAGGPASHDVPGTHGYSLGANVRAEADAEEGTVGQEEDVWLGAAGIQVTAFGEVSDSSRGALNPLTVAVPDPSLNASCNGEDGCGVGNSRFPWLYAGVVESSGGDRASGPWRGFGGNSDGWVESVFDLTPFAGTKVRLRFLAATANPESEFATERPGVGWFLDGLAVHALGEPGVRILDLASPGDGAILPADAPPFHPTVVVQNEHPEQVSAQAILRLRGGNGTWMPVDLGAGPTARAFAASHATFQELADGQQPGLYRIDVEVGTTVETDGSEDLDAGAGLRAPATHARSFHVQVGGGQEWRVAKAWTEAVPILEDDLSIDPATRLIDRGQTLRVHALVESLGPQDRNLSIDPQAPDAELRPVLRSLDGSPEGTSTATQKNVSLPASRSVAGTLGDTDAARHVMWTWDGTDHARPYVLTLENATGDVVWDGGTVRVEAMAPDPVHLDRSNLWSYQEGCDRVPELAEKTGVLSCSGGGSALSPSTNVSKAHLLDGRDVTLHITYKGSGGNVSLHLNDANPQGARPGAAHVDWNDTAVPATHVPPSADWRTAALDLHTFTSNAADLSANWEEGWLRLNLVTQAGEEQAGEDWMVDSLRLEVGAPGSAVPVLWETLDVFLAPERNGFRSLGGGELARLGTLSPHIEPAPHEGSSTNPDDSVQVSVRDGGAPVLATMRLNETLILDGARPTLHFRHWMSEGAVGHRAFVEVGLRDDGVPPELGDDLAIAWVPVAVFDGAVAGFRRALEPVQVPLWDFAGQEVLLRFRYERDPGSAAAPLQDPAWIVTDVQIELDGQDGRKVLHESRDLEAEYLLDGSVTVVSDYPGPPRRLPKEGGWTFHSPVDSCVVQPRNTYQLGPSSITDPVDLRAASDPVLSLHQGGYLAALEIYKIKKFLDLEYQTLDTLGRWGSWQSTYEFPGPDGELVVAPWDTDDARLGLASGTRSWTREWDGETIDEISLRGLVGEVVRFRFHLWEVTDPNWQRPQGQVSGCGVGATVEQWRIESLHVRERTHLADASVGGITVNLDDSGVLDQLSPAALPGRDGAVVLAAERGDFQVHVQVANEGSLDLSTEVSLTLDAPGALVSFIDPVHNDPLSAPRGPAAVASGENATARFRVQLPGTPPGEYTITARAKTTDAVDTNPFNDLGSRRIIVQPVRALTPERGETSVEAFVGPPDQDRLVQLGLRNRGNVAERVTIDAQVVEYTGISQAHPIGYVLPPRPDVALAARSGQVAQQWDLPHPAVGGILDPVVPGVAPGDDLLLVHGPPSPHGYLRDLVSVRLGEDGFGTFTAPGESDHGTTLRGPTPASPPAPSPTHPVLHDLGPDPVLLLDLDENGEPGPDDRVLSHPDASPGARLGNIEVPDWTAATANLTYVDANDNGRLNADEALYLNVGPAGNLSVTGENVSVRLTPVLTPAGLLLPAGSHVQDGDWDLVQYAGTDEPAAVALATFGGALADRLEPGKRYGVEFRITPAPVTPWWNDTLPPLDVVGGDDFNASNVQLLDITPHERCGCIRAPFLVESLLTSTDLETPFSALPGFDTATGWVAETRLEEAGAFTGVEDRPDLPAWRLAEADDGELPELPGTSGRVWHLPEYVGRDALEHTLTSPVLPAHVVKSTTQAYLDLRYASTLEEGQAVLESRTLLGGRWSGWEPIDAVKSQRVAVVLAPDFPRVTGSWIGQGNDQGPRTPFPDHPIPPFFTSYHGDERDGVVGCTGASQMSRCAWSPFPTFRPDGDPTWVAALASALSRLADEVGPDNVATFSTLDGTDLFLPTQDWPQQGQHPLVALGLNLSADGRFLNVWTENAELARHTVQIPGGCVHCGDDDTLPVHRIPLRDLENLGLTLGRWGAILLVGDNATTTFVSRSATMASVSPESKLRDGAAWPATSDDGEHWERVTLPTHRTPTPIAQRHHEDLFEILRAAPAAGVGVVGALGPATGTLALSGLNLEGVEVTTWMTPGIPYADRYRAGFGIFDPQVRCAVAPILTHPTPNNAQAYEKHYDWGKPNGGIQLPANLEVDQQPKGACAYWTFGPNGGPRKDGANPWNYNYVPSQDAQSLAIQDFIRSAGATFKYVPSGSVGQSCPDHPHNSFGPGGSSCVVLRPPNVIEHAASGRPAVVTAARESDAAQWARDVLSQLQADGSLSEGTGALGSLDPALASPVGGPFVRDAAGDDHYDGSPMQFRLTVRSDPAAPDNPGHGWFLLDSLQLLGTNRTRDVGVRVVEPRDGFTYQPGEEDFHMVVEIVNRGAQDVDELDQMDVTLEAERISCTETCSVATPQKSFKFPVPPVAAGQMLVVTLGADEPVLGEDLDEVQYTTRGTGTNAFYGGRFPAPGGEPARYEFRADLTNAHDESDLNDADLVTAVGHAIHSRLIDPTGCVAPRNCIRVAPNLQPGTGSPSASVLVPMHNDGSIKNQAAEVTIAVREARPQHCWFDESEATGNARARGFWPCDGDGKALLPTALLRTDSQRVSVPRGETTLTQIPLPLADAGIGPGVYEVELTLETPNRQDQTFSSMLYLSQDGLAWDDAVGRYFNTTQATDSQFYVNGPGDLRNAQLCMPDNAARAGNAANPGAPLAHGWRLSSDPAVCHQFLNQNPPHLLEWRRSEQPSAQEGEVWSFPNDPSNPPPNANTMGVADFGPDRVIWQPVRDGLGFPGQGFSRTQPTGPPLTLAAFGAGDADLVLSTQYQASPRTAYVVEMQVASMNCNIDQAGRISSCAWAWNADWFPLHSPGLTRVETNVSQAMTVSNGCNQPQTVCSVTRIPSNPLAGTPGIWGTNATVDPGEPWPVLRYPIDADVQGQGLADYCNGVTDTVDGSNHVPFFTHRHRGLKACQHVAFPLFDHYGRQEAIDRGQGGSAPADIPRPVQFRFSAASYGGDEGLNFWKIRDVALTAHHLAVEGASVVPMFLRDGESDVVPVRIHNAGGVHETVNVRLERDLPTSEGIDAGLSLRSTEAPQPTLSFPLAPGQSRVVWVHARVGFETGLQAGIEWDGTLRVVAESTQDPSAQALAFVDLTFQTRRWADLSMDGVAVGTNAGSGAVTAEAGVPVTLTARYSNRGAQPVGGPDEPVVMRFEVLQDTIDPATGASRLEVEEVGVVYITEQIPRCFGLSCDRFATVEWTPQEQVAYHLRATINQPQDGEADLLPENDYSNNVVGRDIAVGPVRTVDLRPQEAWLVPFVAGVGCDASSHRTSLVVEGDSYCVVARVRNHGLLEAKGVEVHFSADSGTAFSVVHGSEAGSDRLPDPFPGEHTQLVVSSPWTARLGAAGLAEREIVVQVRTAGPNIALTPFLAVPVRVEVYDLVVEENEIREVALHPGERRVLSFNVTNEGDAAAVPVGAVSDPSVLRLDVEHARPMQPGETVEVRVVAIAARSITSTTALPEAFLSTREDAKVRAPLPVLFKLLPEEDSHLQVLPATRAPGPTHLELVLDHAGVVAPVTWRLANATAPLAPDGAFAIEVAPFQRLLHNVSVVVRPHSPPGIHEGNLTFDQTTDGVQRTVQVPYRVEVPPTPGLDAHAPHDRIDAPQGVPATLVVQVRNTGNVPAEVEARHTLDHGHANAFPDAPFVLAPGVSRDVRIEVAGDAATRTLGETNITWRPAGGDWRSTPELPWQVEFHPTVVRIVESDLEHLEPRAGARTDATAVVENRGGVPAEVEVLLVVDGVVQSWQDVLLQAGGQDVVRLSFQASHAAATNVTILARPAGSPLGLDDPTFYVVGDARTEAVSTKSEGFVDRLTPAPHPALALLALAALLARRRTRRDGP